ncbi:MAG: LysR substrate-binding domain-containing protein [Halothiobacillaceae bacterium]
MMRVTLRQLRSFEAVARLRSFSRAAEEMHVTQPTVSKQIRLLTEEVGLPLFEQIGRKVFLTQAGEALHATCAEWLENWGRFEQTIADIKGLKQGRLRIATVTTGKYFMPRVLGPFYAEYPGIEIALEVVNRDRLLERLSRNQDDLYVMGVPPEGWDIVAEPLIENPLVVIAPRNHPRVNESAIALDSLADERFLVRERGSGTRIAMETLAQSWGMKFQFTMELGSNEAIKQAVAGGLGLAMLSRSALSDDPAKDDLAVLDVQGFPILRQWYVVRPRGKQTSVVAETFLSFLHAHIREIVPAA